MAKEIKRKVVKASDAKAEKEKKARRSKADEAERKVKRSAAEEPEEELEAEEEETEERESRREKRLKDAGSGKSAVGWRIGAIIFWLLAIAAEAAVIMLLNGYLYLPFDQMTCLIGGIIIDLIFVVIGSQFWKKANHINPPSKNNKLWFFLCSQMGLIAAVIAFCPLIVILLRNKDLDKKTKRIVTVIAAIALVLAGALSIDYDPVSQEEVAAAEAGYTGVCYWTMYGRSYHFDMDCHTLARSSTLYEGTITEAYEASRTDPCDYCAEGFDEELEEAIDEMVALGE